MNVCSSFAGQLYCPAVNGLPADSKRIPSNTSKGKYAEDTDFSGPEGRDDVGDFVFKDFDDLFVLRLTIGSTLYKYMRIYLLTVVWQ